MVMVVMTVMVIGDGGDGGSGGADGSDGGSGGDDGSGGVGVMVVMVATAMMVIGFSAHRTLVHAILLTPCEFSLVLGDHTRSGHIQPW